MIQKTQHATTNYRMLLPFISMVKALDGHARFTAPGYMDLVIEQLYYTDPYGNQVYSIAHYGEQYGDLMRDPEITFSLDAERGRIIPLSFQNDYIGAYQEILCTRNGKQMYSVSLLKDLDQFLWQWNKNIAEQKFSPTSIRLN